MTSALDIIKKSFSKIGEYAIGETIQAVDAENALDILNIMLDSWRLENITLYSVKRNTFNLTTAQSYTIGLGGDFNIPRPTSIINAYCTYINVDYPMGELTSIDYDSIQVKQLNSLIPQYFYYNPTYPIGKIYLYPKPNGGATSITISSYQEFPTFTDLTTTFDLPPGYERAIIYNLAIELCSDYGASPSEAVVSIARKAKNNVQNANIVPQTSLIDVGAGFVGSRYNIYTGT